MDNLLEIGSVLWLPAGLHVYHNQMKQVIKLESPIRVVVESNRKVLPFQQTGVEAHFEETYMLKARALLPDGNYDQHGAHYTFAQYGDFRPEFILPKEANVVLWKMKQTFTS